MERHDRYEAVLGIHGLLYWQSGWVLEWAREQGRHMQITLVPRGTILKVLYVTDDPPILLSGFIGGYFQIRYEPYGETLPVERTGGLFYFRDLKDALAAREGEGHVVYHCYAYNAKRLPKVSVFYSNVFAFWRGELRDKDLVRPPEGTWLAEKIVITAPVTQGDILVQYHALQARLEAAQGWIRDLAKRLDREK